MRVVLDACVLFPTVLREVLIGVAEAGLLQPVWSPRILGEWTRAAARLGPEQARIAAVEAALLGDRWPGASIEAQGGAEGLDLPDPADRHVVEAALAAGAAVIVTLNLRDFPRPAMAAAGLAARHPDSVLTEFWAEHPDAVAGAVARVHDKALALGGDMTLRAMLKRANLPRLGKALTRA